MNKLSLHCVLILLITLGSISCKKENIDDDPNTGNELHISKILFSYEDFKTLIPFEEIEFLYNDEKVLQEMKYYEYDDFGNKELDGYIKFFYAGNLVSHNKVYYDNELYMIERYYYDGSGKFNKYEHYNENDVLEDTYLIEYNDQGQIISIGPYAIMMDERGNVVNERLSYAGNPIYEINYADFDNKNNPWRPLNLPYAPEKGNINKNNCKKWNLIDLDLNDPLSVGDADAYTYEYNADNYPVKSVSQQGYVTEYEYLEESGGGGGNGNNTYTFTIEFKNGYVQDWLWIIVYSPDGSEIKDSKKIFGDGEVSFELDDERVTFTIINSRPYISGKKKFLISSDINVPGGKYIFSEGSRANSSLGSVDMNINFSQNNYEDYVLSFPQYSLSGHLDQAPIQANYNIYTLEPNQKISSLCFVYNDSQQGIYGYTLDQDFVLNTTNPISYTLDKPLELVTMSSNKPIEQLNLYAYKGNDYLGFRVGKNTTNDHLTHKVLHAAEFPRNMSGYSASYSNNDIYYTKSVNSINDISAVSVIIPDATINGSYDPNSQKFHSIQISGTMDQIRGQWSYLSDEVNAFWIVYQHASASEIGLLAIPANIINDIGFNPDLLEPFTLELIEFNTTSNYDEIVERFLKQENPFYVDYQEWYLYSIFIDNKAPGSYDNHRGFEWQDRYPF